MDPAALPLRDIHLPEAVSWWPPAAGWWLLAGTLLAVIAGALLWRAWRRRTALRRAALAELRAIRARYAADANPAQLAAELSILCRRVAVSLDPDPAVAALTGSAWLERLDALSPAQGFRAGPGQVLVSAPYDPRVRFDPPSLLAGCEAWLKRLPASRAHV